MTSTGEEKEAKRIKIFLAIDFKSQIMVQLYSGVHVGATLIGRERRLRIHHEAMKVLMRFCKNVSGKSLF